MWLKQRSIFYWISLAALFLIPAFALITLDTYSPFIFGRAIYFRILVEIAFCAWLILSVIDRKYRPRFTPLSIGVTVFTVIVLAADLFGVSPVSSIFSNFDRMEGWVLMVHVWAFFMVSFHILGQDEKGALWRRWFGTSLCVAVIVGVYGLLQIFGVLDIHYDSARIDASFGNPNFLAAYLLLHFFIALYLANVTFKRYTKIAYLYLVPALLFAYEIFKTGTRGSFLALLVGTVCIGVLYVIFGPASRKRIRVVSGTVVIVIMAISGFIWMERNSAWIQSFPSLSRIVQISWSDSDARKYIWPMAMQGFAERPLLGWGQENFTYVYQKEYDPAAHTQEEWFDRVHNVFLEYLVDSGSIGFIAYIALYILCILVIWKSARSVAEKSVVTGLLCAYAVNAAFTLDELSSYVLFYAVLAFVSSSWPKRTQLAEREAPLRDVQATSACLNPILTGIAGLILVFAVYVCVVRPAETDYFLVRAHKACSDPNPDAGLFASAFRLSEGLSHRDILAVLLPCVSNIVNNPQVNQPTKNNFVDLAVRQARADIVASPNDAQTYALSGPFFRKIGRLAESEEILTEAHALMPSKDRIAFELADTYIYEGKFQDASDLLAKMYSIEADSDTAATAYAISIAMAGDSGRAEAIPVRDESVVQKSVELVHAKDYSGAASIFDSFVSGPITIDVLVQQARILYAEGKVSDAVSILRTIADQNPQYAKQIQAAIDEVQTASK